VELDRDFENRELGDVSAIACPTAAGIQALGVRKAANSYTKKLHKVSKYTGFPL